MASGLTSEGAPAADEQDLSGMVSALPCSNTEPGLSCHVSLQASPPRRLTASVRRSVRGEMSVSSTTSCWAEGQLRLPSSRSRRWRTSSATSCSARASRLQLRRLHRCLQGAQLWLHRLRLHLPARLLLPPGVQRLQSLTSCSSWLPRLPPIR